MPVAKYCGIVTFAFCAVLPLMAKAGTLTTLYTFTGDTDGGNPVGALSYDHGALYGTTSEGNNLDFNGNVFKIDAATGQFKVVHSFQGGADGALPQNGVVYAGGMLYGTTEAGGKPPRARLLGLCTVVFNSAQTIRLARPADATYQLPRVEYSKRRNA